MVPGVGGGVGGDGVLLPGAPGVDPAEWVAMMLGSPVFFLHGILMLVLFAMTIGVARMRKGIQRAMEQVGDRERPNCRGALARE